MGFESTATWLDDLVATNPLVGDNVSQGDDHLRLLKSVLKGQFPGLTSFARYLEIARTDAADSATPALWATASNYVNLLGATTITGFASGVDGQQKIVRFDAVRTLTHHATTLALPSGADITTAAGDHALIANRGTTSNIVLAYWRANGSVFPAGTAMLFLQTTAPVGWTKSTAHNDKALRIVSGTASSGGTTAFSSVFAARTITTANMPSHSHTGTTGNNSVSHTHQYQGAGSTGVPDYGSGTALINSTTLTSGPASALHTHSFTTATSGSGTSIDFAVQYVDAIIATKDA
jgi:hypothetical protein